MKPIKILAVIGIVLLGIIAIALVTNYMTKPAKQLPEKRILYHPAIPAKPEVPKETVSEVTKTEKPKVEEEALIPPPAEISEDVKQEVSYPEESYVEETRTEEGMVSKGPTPPPPSPELPPPKNTPEQLPSFTPISSPTGPVPAAPQAPTSSRDTAAAGATDQAAPVQDIASFIPVVSPTGPASDENKEYKKLPPFTPITSKTGPVKTTEE